MEALAAASCRDAPMEPVHFCAADTCVAVATGLDAVGGNCCSDVYPDAVANTTIECSAWESLHPDTRSAALHIAFVKHSA